MTIEIQTTASGPYAGNGVTTIFAYAFKVYDSSQIKVTQTVSGVATTVSPASYSVTGAGAESGTVVFAAAPASGASILIERNMPFVQELDLSNQGAFFADDLERGLDEALMRDLQLNEGVGRALKKPVGSSNFDAGGARIVNLGDAVDDDDAVSRGLVEQIVADTAIEQFQAAGAEFSRYPLVLSLRTLASTIEAGEFLIEPETSREVVSNFFHGKIIDGEAGASCKVRFRNGPGGTVLYGPVTITQGTEVLNSGVGLTLAQGTEVWCEVYDVSGNIRHVTAKLDAQYGGDAGTLYGDFLASGAKPMTGPLNANNHGVNNAGPLAGVTTINGQSWVELLDDIDGKLVPDNIGVSVQAKITPVAAETLALGASTDETTITAAKLAVAVPALQTRRSGVSDAALHHLQANGTNGGASVGGSWQTYPLNTEDDPSGLVSLSANQFEFTVDGEIEFIAGFYSTGDTRVRIYNVTDGAVVGRTGPGGFASSTNSDYLMLSVRAKVAAGKVYRAEYRCVNSEPSNGLGRNAGFGEDNIYGTVTFWRGF